MTPQKQKQYIDAWLSLDKKLTVGEAGRRLHKLQAKYYNTNKLKG